MGTSRRRRTHARGARARGEDWGQTTGLASAREKRHCVTLLGVEEAQRLVGEYTKEALEALQEFPGDAGFLREYAIALVERDT